MRMSMMIKGTRLIKLIETNKRNNIKDWNL